MNSRARRVEDRIRELCAEAVEEQNPRQAEMILAELQQAIHQYTQRLRHRAAAVLSGYSNIPLDRRKVPYHRRDRSP